MQLIDQMSVLGPYCSWSCAVLSILRSYIVAHKATANQGLTQKNFRRTVPQRHDVMGVDLGRKKTRLRGLPSLAPQECRKLVVSFHLEINRNVVNIGILDIICIYVYMYIYLYI